MRPSALQIREEEQRIWHLLSEVPDPEVPVLSILDLGIVRRVFCPLPQHRIEVTITPTYSGCPAMDMIAMQIRMTLIREGYQEVEIKRQLSPAWTTDWMTEGGRQKLKAYGIAPPGKRAATGGALFAAPESVPCPLCDSLHTERISEFGSTACKALYRCHQCREPFEHFKCH